ncbi:hypothetical protein GCM10010210_10090 [Pseudonocardia hydrocarbonoxydans]|uniref:Uncharacterized protein n=1 Tax=Pseudonocardia hydrocarbonoxydans TaxID=76726 RepID=A0A4Y3WR61_9PSEU|nr:hypothetical protein PHY01_36550 [Pseudonocardia hydrocarbonoxydans]
MRSGPQIRTRRCIPGYAPRVLQPAVLITEGRARLDHQGRGAAADEARGGEVDDHRPGTPVRRDVEDVAES